MHECPNCYQACDCDGDDLWTDDPELCLCKCWSEEDDEFCQMDEDDAVERGRG